MRERFFAGPCPVEVLYLDNHLLVVVKPPNLPAQRDASGDPDLLGAAKAYVARVFDKPGEAFLGLVHRLDRPVGGLMVLARTSKAAARLSDAFATRQVDKGYLAVVRGAVDGPLTLTDWLLKDPRTGSVRVVPRGTPGAKEARLASWPIGQWEALTLMRVRPETGRSHQIRVQHAHAGHPLWGDARYGGGKPGQQIALWADRLALTHPVRREPMAFRAPPPARGIWQSFRTELEAEDAR